MVVREVCSREVVVAQRGESVLHAAQLMRQHHVGSVVVVEARDARSVPVGILTDRDIAVGVVALGLDPRATPVEAAMRAHLASVKEFDSVGKAVLLMKQHAVRRLPVIDASGCLAGIVAADDLLDVLSGEVSALAGISQGSTDRERSARTATL